MEASSPLRVLHLINSLGAGGAERFCIALSNEQARLGHQVRLTTFYQLGPLASDVDPAVETKALGIGGPLRGREFRQLRRVIRDFRPQVVHGFLDNANRYGLVAARLGGVPAVVSSFQNVYAHVGPRYAAIDRFAFRFADAGIPCSEEVLRFYADQWRFPERKLHLLPNSVQVGRIPCQDSSLRAEVRAELGLADGDLAFVTVASLGEQKGHRFLIEAAEQVAARHPRACWLLIGDGPLRAELSSRIEQRGLAERVRLLGIRDDVPRLLQGMDVFVLPSLWEGLSLAVLEASASGLPVLATDVSGTKAIVEAGITGWRVPPADPAALVTAMEEALADPARLPALGRAGRAKIEREFDVEPVAARVVALYREILAQRG